MTTHRFLRYLIRRARYNIDAGLEWNRHDDREPIGVGAHLVVVSLCKRMQGLLVLGKRGEVLELGRRLKRLLRMVDRS